MVDVDDNDCSMDDGDDAGKTDVIFYSVKTTTFI